MKKIKTLAMITTAIVVGSVAVSAMASTTKHNTSKTQSQTIGAQRAKEIALAHAGLKEADVRFEKAKLEYDNRVAVYEVEFYTNGTEYDYEINAVNGTIVESHKENKRTQSSSNQNSNNQGSNNQNSSNQNANNQTSQNNMITEAKAKEAALAHAGLKAGNVVFEKVELDREHGVSVYEVEFRHNGVEYNYEINATNGTVTEFEVDHD